MRFVPDRPGFEELARRGRLAFVYKEILADADTPVSAYAKLGRSPYSFLLESVVGGEKWAAYSFVGVRPRAVIRARGEDVEILTPEGDQFVVSERVKAKEPVRFLDQYLAKLSPAVPPGLPRFFGGAVGWLTYDIVRSFERLPATKPDDLGLPELCFAITDTVVIFDNLRGTLKVVAAADVGDGVDLDRAYADACARIDGVLDRLAKPAARLRPLDPEPPAAMPPPQSTVTKEAYEAGVRRIQEYILAGDAFQVVYSQRFQIPRGDVDPFDVYRALRVTNPSPYMFHLEFPEAIVTGASPEVLVRMENGHVEVRPIAGTARRGATPEEDARLEAEMRGDPKEVAEHVMLIDLGRNDVGRVSAPGTVRVTETMVTERYSHVMHLVSNVRGQVAPGTRPGDVLRASFPAGTLSGAPKIRAMEIIEESEPFRRNLYGGAVGYISYDGNLDTAIAIRTLVTKGDTIYVQAGAGLVADSVPASEYAECHNKARAVLAAVEIARRASGGK
ncbi:MAG TPA: anthranilate synthase component I [Polyangia bacterium]|nr:anthranilate synthase component I [Polyangia bacterium]